VARNAQQTLTLHKTRRASDLTTRSLALTEIQEALGLNEAPLRVECIDVSNLQGTEVVASLVVFEDGLPRKSEYRRFAIRGFEGQDDVASIREVVGRRFRRFLDEREQATDLEIDAVGDDSTSVSAEARPGIDPDTGRPRRFAYAPNLLVVDGGAPQVAAAQQALDELGIDDVAVCGLAKRLEEVWLPNTAEPVILGRTSEALYLLQRVRDEAHRFAITYHRQRRSRSMTASALDGVPGLGETRRKALLRHFGSLKRLRTATAAEIAEVPGVGPRTAAAVVAALAQPGSGAAGVNVATGEILD
jgi:excinuclease ABC subunit C